VLSDSRACLAHRALRSAGTLLPSTAGRGTPDYPDAELTLNSSGSHVVRVVFVGYRPLRGRADWSLRDCLNTAARYAGSRDIVASLWYRERDDRQPREPLAPYSATYKASSRTVVIHQKLAAN